MASRADVAMAQFGAQVAEEERKMEKRIEDSTTIRSLQNIDAMASGATMGHQLGKGLSEGVDMMKGFNYRRRARRGYIKDAKNRGMTGKEARQSWRKDGKKQAMSMYDVGKEQGFSHKTMVSLYLDGVNTNPADGNPKPTSNINSSPEVYAGPLEGGGRVGGNDPQVPFTNTTTSTSLPGEPVGTEDSGYYFGKNLVSLYNRFQNKRSGGGGAG